MIQQSKKMEKAVVTKMTKPQTTPMLQEKQSQMIGVLDNGNRLGSLGRTGSPGGGSAPTNAGLPGATRQGILGQFFGGGQRNAAPKNNDRSQPVSEAEIRAQIPVVQAVFEIGKEGSEYENGIRDFGAILNLAKAYSIIPKLYRSFKDMEKADPTITEGALGAYNPNNRQRLWQ